MRRSTGVTVAGSLLVAGGIFLGFGAIMGALGQVMMRSMPALPNMPKTDIPLAVTISVFGWEAALAAWAIITAVGIFRLRRWAWISMLVISGVTTAFTALAVVGIIAALPLMKAEPPPPGVPAGFVMIAMVGALVVFAIPLGCGIWWLILFSRKSVRLQFQAGSHLVASEPVFAAGAPTVSIPAVNELEARRIPVCILVIAIYLVALTPFAVMALAMPMIRRMPVMLFGAVFWPRSGWIYMLALAVIHLVLGIGLLRRQKWAWLWSCVYAVFLIANGVATAVRPHIYERMMGILRQAMPEFAQLFANMPGLRTEFYVGMVFGIAPPIAAVYFLWTRREAYRGACAAK